jgi:hypothetical protein
MLICITQSLGYKHPSWKYIEFYSVLKGHILTILTVTVSVW